ILTCSRASLTNSSTDIDASLWWEGQGHPVGGFVPPHCLLVRPRSITKERDYWYTLISIVKHYPTLILRSRLYRLPLQRLQQLRQGVAHCINVIDIPWPFSFEAA